MQEKCYKSKQILKKNVENQRKYRKICYKSQKLEENWKNVEKTKNIKENWENLIINNLVLIPNIW